MKLILKNIFTNRNTCYYLWFALPRANKLKVKVFSGVELHYQDLFHGKIGGHFFRKEFLPDVSLNSLGKWMYHTGNHFLSIIPFS